MCEATRSFLPAPYLPDNLLVFRGAGVDDNLPAYHAAFAALRGQPFPFKLHVRKRPHPTAAIKAVGGIVRFPERIVIAEDLAMERPVVWAGAAVEYRDIHPPRPFLRVGEHGPVTPVHVGALDVLKKDQGQARRKIQPSFRHLSRFRVDALSLPGPALRPQDRD